MEELTCCKVDREKTLILENFQAGGTTIMDFDIDWIRHVYIRSTCAAWVMLQL